MTVKKNATLSASQRLQKKMTVLLIAAIGIFLLFPSNSLASRPNWYKGNLHAHSQWSDGDVYPEMVAKIYKDRGYNFLCISDHNRLSQGIKWYNVKETYGGEKAFDKYLAQFGDDWVERRDANGVLSVRLKPLNEFRCLFEETGKFLLIQAEEITDKVHLNAINLSEVIMPQGGGTLTEVLQNNIDASLRQGKKTGQEPLVMINHPTYQWALTAEDILPVNNASFLEIHNGYPGVPNYGDKLHASTERIWDILLAKRLSLPQGEIIYGIASDDAHNYLDFGPDKANPGRGWIMVRANYLTPESITKAMKAGSFYASSGVTLKDIAFDGKTLRIEIQAEPNVAYTTQFIGTLKGYDPASKPVVDANGVEIHTTRIYSSDIGRVLAEVKGAAATYSLTGNELYVRAKVISNKAKENPYAAGDVEVAWIQPVKQ